MEDSQFIIPLVVAQFILSFLRCVALALQSTECNLVDAYADVTLARECIRDSQNERCWEKLCTKATQLALTFGLTIEKPRTARAQIYRDNVGSIDQSPSTYYRFNVFYPFIDHVVTELETRFSNDHEGLVAIQHLIPVSLGELNNAWFLWKFLSVNEKDLVTDIANWKKKYECVNQSIQHFLSTVLKPFQCCVHLLNYSSWKCIRRTILFRTTSS